MPKWQEGARPKHRQTEEERNLDFYAQSGKWTHTTQNNANKKQMGCVWGGTNMKRLAIQVNQSSKIRVEGKPLSAFFPFSLDSGWNRKIVLGTKKKKGSVRRLYMLGNDGTSSISTLTRSSLGWNFIIARKHCLPLQIGQPEYTDPRVQPQHPRQAIVPLPITSSGSETKVYRKNLAPTPNKEALSESVRCMRAKNRNMCENTFPACNFANFTWKKWSRRRGVAEEWDDVLHTGNPTWPVW